MIFPPESIAELTGIPGVNTICAAALSTTARKDCIMAFSAVVNAVENIPEPHLYYIASVLILQEDNKRKHRTIGIQQ